MSGCFDRRIGQHKWGLIEGFTKEYGCHRVLYYEIYTDALQAKRREIQVKGWRSDKKVRLIEKIRTELLAASL